MNYTLSRQKQVHPRTRRSFVPPERPSNRPIRNAERVRRWIPVCRSSHRQMRRWKRRDLQTRTVVVLHREEDPVDVWKNEIRSELLPAENGRRKRTERTETYRTNGTYRTDTTPNPHNRDGNKPTSWVDIREKPLRPISWTSITTDEHYRETTWR